MCPIPYPYISEWGGHLGWSLVVLDSDVTDSYFAYFTCDFDPYAISYEPNKMPAVCLNLWIQKK